MKFPFFFLFQTFISLGYESRISIIPTLFEAIDFIVHLQLNCVTSFIMKHFNGLLRILKATDAIRKIPMFIRQCIFENENFLSYYR